jgi:hypothetical protein
LEPPADQAHPFQAVLERTVQEEELRPHALGAIATRRPKLVVE